MSVWLGRLDSNQRMRESKSLALPLGDAPMWKEIGDRGNPDPLLCLGWEMGLEPTTPGTTIRCSNQLSYTHHISWNPLVLTFAPKGELVRQKGLEPLAYCLEGSCSIQLSYWREFVGAGDENRTRIPSLEGWCPDHCATPAYALHGNCQLGYINIRREICQASVQVFFLIFLCAPTHLQKRPEESVSVYRLWPGPPAPQALWMPLDRPHRQRPVEQCLDCAVRCPLDRLQPGPQPVRRLVVGAVDHGVLPIQHSQRRRRCPDRMQPVPSICLAVPRNVLEQRAAKEYVHCLKSPADPQHRPPQYREGLQQRQFLPVPCRVQAPGGRVLLPVPPGLQVPASRQQQRGAGNSFPDVLRQAYPSSRRFHGIGVILIFSSPSPQKYLPTHALTPFLMIVYYTLFPPRKFRILSRLAETFYLPVFRGLHQRQKYAIMCFSVWIGAEAGAVCLVRNMYGIPARPPQPRIESRVLSFRWGAFSPDC